MKRWLPIIIVFIAVIRIGIFGYQYMSDQQTYISTDNATVQADLYPLDATRTGVLSDWKIKEGDNVKQGDVVGRITNKPLAAKMDGTIVKTSVYIKQNVFQGQTIAQIANLNNAYVMAYIDEDKISLVKEGKEVKVTIESLSDESYDGKVVNVGSATGAYYQNSSSAAADSTEKEVQRIPVKISVSDLPIKRLTIGVHAEVKIEK